MDEITPIAALRDNYIWAIHEGDACVVVDPGEAAPVLRHLEAQRLRLTAILITHRHHDHVDGVPDILAHHPAPVFGPGTIACVTEPVGETSALRVPGLSRPLQVLAVPGHTEDHIAYLLGDALFCGDTLFSAGCGRLMGGTAGQLHAAHRRILALPDATRIFCTHEYTLANLRFAAAVEPGNADIDSYRQHCEALRDRDQVTLPSTLAQERRINPFLRWDVPTVKDAAERFSGKPLSNPVEVFAALRMWKDGFR